MSFFKAKNGVYLIAEIGGNHEGDFEYAKELTYLAAESGVDAVKYQIYTGDSLVNPRFDHARNRHFKKFQLSESKYIELAQLCQRLDVTFLASVWDIGAIEYIDHFSSMYKVGSGDMTAYNFIRRLVETGKPIILSTGLSTLEEVGNTVKFVEEIDVSYLTEKKLSILQCTSMYPIPNKDANLNVMRRYAELFGLPVGYSDHTVGQHAIEVAVAMGAEIIEVHFTDKREGKKFRDHKVSLTQEEIKIFLSNVRKIRELQGEFEKIPAPSEIESGHVTSFRRSVYVSRDLPKGHILAETDLLTLRPHLGVGAEFFYDLVGMKLERPMKKLDYFEPSFLSENLRIKIFGQK